MAMVSWSAPANDEWSANRYFSCLLMRQMKIIALKGTEMFAYTMTSISRVSVHAWPSNLDSKLNAGSWQWPPLGKCYNSIHA